MSADSDAALRAAGAQARGAERRHQLAQFAHAASHELAEPVRVVAHHLQLLARHQTEPLGDDANRQLELAMAGVTQMNDLLADLLAYGQAATAEPARVPVDCDAVVAASLARLDGFITRTLFQRLHHRNEYDGNDVGLSLCSRLVAYHGGRVWVDPNPGGGSIFRFTMPET
jgi:light-regulated signal transduction histidine kinase (bacteriophytochrome)